MEISPTFSNLLSLNNQVMTNLEIWKVIPSTDKYQVSNFGNVRAPERWVNTHSDKVKLHKAKSVSVTDNGHGYKLFATKLYGQKKKNFYLHRMVAILFIPNPNNLPEVNHKDGDKSNNHVFNLEWTDRQGNQDHAKENRLIAFGERTKNAKLKLDDVLRIIQLFKDNPNLSKCAIAREYGVRDTTIHKILKGQRWSIAIREGYSLPRTT